MLGACYLELCIGTFPFCCGVDFAATQIIIQKEATMKHKFPKGIITQPQLEVGPVRNQKELTASMAHVMGRMHTRTSHTPCCILSKNGELLPRLSNTMEYFSEETYMLNRTSLGFVPPEDL